MGRTQQDFFQLGIAYLVVLAQKATLHIHIPFNLLQKQHLLCRLT